jgi:putative SOS response-associated peptidase YedK
MCNLYSITTSQAAIIALFRVVNRYVGNLAPMPGVFPDYPAPVIRNTDTGRALSMMRWGMPPSPRTGGPPVTNIRNTSSPHWRAWLKPENRCLVPFNSFAEYAPEPNPETKKKDVVWFALNDDRPLTAFAGIWTEFTGDRGTEAGAGSMREARDDVRFCSHSGLKLGTAPCPFCAKTGSGGYKPRKEKAA